MDTGPTPIGQAAELVQVRRQAARVHAKSVGLALALTAAAMLLAYAAAALG